MLSSLWTRRLCRLSGSTASWWRWWRRRRTRHRVYCSPTKTTHQCCPGITAATQVARGKWRPRGIKGSSSAHGTASWAPMSTATRWSSWSRPLQRTRGPSWRPARYPSRTTTEQNTSIYHTCATGTRGWALRAPRPSPQARLHENSSNASKWAAYPGACYRGGYPQRLRSNWNSSTKMKEGLPCRSILCLLRCILSKRFAFRIRCIIFSTGCCFTFCVCECYFDLKHSHVYFQVYISRDFFNVVYLNSYKIRRIYKYANHVTNAV